MSSETILQERVANYLAQNYPDVQFHSDFGSGADLSKKQAALQSRQNAKRRGWPDLVIAYPHLRKKAEFGPAIELTDENGDFAGIGRSFSPPVIFCGMYLELKKEGEKLYPSSRSHPCNHYKSKDGKEYRTKHLMEQADVLYALRNCGYFADFAIGYDAALRFIHAYLGEPRPPKVEF